MRLGKKVLVVIPARGGSKGVVRKNITLVKGRPLITYTTELLGQLPWVDLAVVSTDDREIADIARQSGAVSIVWRPEHLAGDQIGDMPVLRHALLESEQHASKPFDVVVMLQPTSPLRTGQEVEASVDQLIEGAWEAVWTVSETDLSYHPHKQVKISQAGNLEFFVSSGSRVVARQQLEPAFHRNGASYAFSANFVRSSESVFSPANTTGIISSKHHVSIDTPEDIQQVEAMLPPTT